jgi:hypothetical protein
MTAICRLLRGDWRFFFHFGGGHSGYGRLPKWPTGADCKSAGLRLRWFESITYHHSVFIAGTLYLYSVFNGLIITTVFESPRFCAFIVPCVPVNKTGKSHTKGIQDFKADFQYTSTRTQSKRATGRMRRNMMISCMPRRPGNTDEGELTLTHLLSTLHCIVFQSNRCQLKLTAGL